MIHTQDTASSVWNGRHSSEQPRLNLDPFHTQRNLKVTKKPVRLACKMMVLNHDRNCEYAWSAFHH